MEPFGFDAEQRCKVEPPRQLRLHGLHERPRGRRPFLPLRLAPLGCREDRGHNGESEQHSKDDCETEELSLPSLRALELRFLRCAARVEELAFRRRQRAVPLVCPLERRVKTRAAVELTRIALEAEPLVRVVREPPVDL